MPSSQNLFHDHVTGCEEDSRAGKVIADANRFY